MPVQLLALCVGVVAATLVIHWVLRRLMKRPNDWQGHWPWDPPEE